MSSIPHGIGQVLLANGGPILAFAAALAGALLCRAKARRHWLVAVGSVACLIGWAALYPRMGVFRLAMAGRAGPELLLVPAGISSLAELAAAWLRRGRVARWIPASVAAFAGWWLAASPAGRPEFWRVWAATLLLCWLLKRAFAAEPARPLACAVALWLGLLLVGIGGEWVSAALVVVAASAGLLVAGHGATLAGAIMASAIVGADLAAGRLVRGAVNAADIACAASCVAPFLARVAAANAGKRLGPAGTVLAAVASGAIAAGLGWLVHRAVRS